MIKKLKKNILQLLIIIALVYFTVVVSIYFYQRNLLYHPNENNYSGDKLTVDVENVKIESTSDLLNWLFVLLFSGSLVAGKKTKLIVSPESNPDTAVSF